MSITTLPVEEKSIHHIKFFVQKNIGRLNQTEHLEYEFIGTESNFNAFYENKRRCLFGKYNYIELIEHSIEPPDARLIFGNNIF